MFREKRTKQRLGQKKSQRDRNTFEKKGEEDNSDKNVRKVTFNQIDQPIERSKINFTIPVSNSPPASV